MNNKRIEKLVDKIVVGLDQCGTNDCCGGCDDEWHRNYIRQILQDFFKEDSE